MRGSGWSRAMGCRMFDELTPGLQRTRDFFQLEAWIMTHKDGDAFDFDTQYIQSADTA
jgi:hypothetical protein